MHRYLFIAVALPLAAAAQQPIVRAAIASPAPIIVGQAVRLDVTVLVPNYFTGAPDFPQLNIENAIVTLSDETHRHSNEKIGDQSFTGIGVTYLIYPQQPGVFQIPPAQVTAPYASEPPKSIVAHIPFNDVRFEATIPPQAARLDYFLPSDSVTITQQFDRPLKNLKVGDAFTRTVTITCSRLRAMLIPPIKFDAPDGLTVYPKQPEVNDVADTHGALVSGKRIDTATYIVKKEGSYTLPEIEVTWWNLTAGRIQTAALSSIVLTAVANPGNQTELAPEPEAVAAPSTVTESPRHRYRRLMEIAALSALGAGVLLFLWVRFGPRLLRRWRERRIAQRDSEPAYFARLRKACQKGHAPECYSLLMAWLSRFRPHLALDRFLSDAADPELTRQVEALASSLYATSPVGVWSGARMITELRRVRGKRRPHPSPHHSLPALNPHAD